MSDHIIDWEDVDQLKKLLVGRKIVKVKGDKLILDNAAVLDVVPNYGCGGCPAGEYRIDFLNAFDNVITNVEVKSYYDRVCGEYIFVFVFAESEIKEPIIAVSGNEGNGFYGRGFEIKVKNPIPIYGREMVDLIRGETLRNLKEKYGV